MQNCVPFYLRALLQDAVFYSPVVFVFCYCFGCFLLLFMMLLHVVVVHMMVFVVKELKLVFHFLKFLYEKRSSGSMWNHFSEMCISFAKKIIFQMYAMDHLVCKTFNLDWKWKKAKKLWFISRQFIEIEHDWVYFCWDDSYNFFLKIHPIRSKKWNRLDIFVFFIYIWNPILCALNARNYQAIDWIYSDKKTDKNPPESDLYGYGCVLSTFLF